MPGLSVEEEFMMVGNDEESLFSWEMHGPANETVSFLKYLTGANIHQILNNCLKAENQSNDDDMARLLKEIKALQEEIQAQDNQIANRLREHLRTSTEWVAATMFTKVLAKRDENQLQLANKWQALSDLKTQIYQISRIRQHLPVIEEGQSLTRDQAEVLEAKFKITIGIQVLEDA